MIALIMLIIIDDGGCKLVRKNCCYFYDSDLVPDGRTLFLTIM